MGRLNITTIGYNNAIDNITINGKPCKVIKNKDRSRTISTEVEGNVAHVVIYKGHGYIGRHWLLWSILYFIISIFGIFDNKYNKRPLVVDCRFDISMGEGDTDVKLVVRTFRDKEPLLDIDTDTEVNMISNVVYFDTEAKVRVKKAKRVKVLVFLLFVAAIVALIL